MRTRETSQESVERLLSLQDDLPMSKHLILFAITGIITTFIIWANIAALDELTRGQGEVIPSKEVQVISNLEGGIVEALLVKEDDEVEKGEILMRLRDVSATSDLESNEVRVNGLRAAIARLQAEAESSSSIAFGQVLLDKAPAAIAEQKRVFLANKQQLDTQLRILDDQLRQRRQEIVELRTRMSGVNEQITMTVQEKNQIEPAVERGSLPQLDLLRVEQRLGEQQSELASLKSSLPRLQSAVAEAERRKQDLISTARAEAQAELAEKFAEMSTLEKTLGALEDRKVRTEITSPVDGIIKNIAVTTIGGVVKPGENIIEVVPKDDKLVIEARIKPEDVAFLVRGQEAVVKITAYDFAIYGGLAGQLIDISADTIKTDDGESFYRARIETVEPTLYHKGQELPIRPGMQASVDIVTGNKTIMDYILKPIIKTLKGALRER